MLVSDTHIGCRLGLCPEKGVPLDEGFYHPSRAQKIVWKWWEEFWRWVEHTTNGEPYSVVFNGDALDGVHHSSVTQWSHNMEDQRRAAQMVLGPIAKKAARYYHIRGTEAHVGKSGQDEEALGKALGAIPNEDGQHARWDLWLRSGPYLGHYTHHIAGVHSPMSEATGIHAELVQAFVEAGRWGDEPPDYVARSHRHRQYEVRFATQKGYALGVISPAWQLKTPFTHKITGARMTQPQFGGVILVAGDDQLYTKSFVRRIARSREE